MALRKSSFPIYPKPKIWDSMESLLIIPEQKIIIIEENFPVELQIIINNWIKRHNFEIAEKKDGNIKLLVQKNTGKEMMYQEPIGNYSDEIYKINCYKQNDIFTVEITYACLPGLRNALASTAQILSKNSISQCSFTDYPDFKIRGIIEGY